MKRNVICSVGAILAWMTSPCLAVLDHGFLLTPDGAPRYEFTDIGPEFPGVWPTSINDQGQVAGWVTDAENNRQPFQGRTLFSAPMPADSECLTAGPQRLRCSQFVEPLLD